MTFEQGGPAETDPIDDDDVSSDQDEDLDLDDEANDKALDDLVLAVTAGAADLQKFGSTELDRDLTNQFVTATRLPRPTRRRLSEILRASHGSMYLKTGSTVRCKAFCPMWPLIGNFLVVVRFEFSPKCDPRRC